MISKTTKSYNQGVLLTTDAKQVINEKYNEMVPLNYGGSVENLLFNSPTGSSTTLRGDPFYFFGIPMITHVSPSEEVFIDPNDNDMAIVRTGDVTLKGNWDSTSTSYVAGDIVQYRGTDTDVGDPDAVYIVKSPPQDVGFDIPLFDIVNSFGNATFLNNPVMRIDNNSPHPTIYKLTPSRVSQWYLNAEEGTIHPRGISWENVTVDGTNYTRYYINVGSETDHIHKQIAEKNNATGSVTYDFENNYWWFTTVPPQMPNVNDTRYYQKIYKDGLMNIDSNISQFFVKSSPLQQDIASRKNAMKERLIRFGNEFLNSRKSKIDDLAVSTSIVSGLISGVTTGLSDFFADTGEFRLAIESWKNGTGGITGSTIKSMFNTRLNQSGFNNVVDGSVYSDLLNRDNIPQTFKVMNAALYNLRGLINGISNTYSASNSANVDFYNEATQQQSANRWSGFGVKSGGNWVKDLPAKPFGMLTDIRYLATADVNIINSKLSAPNNNLDEGQIIEQFRLNPSNSTRSITSVVDGLSSKLRAVGGANIETTTNPIGNGADPIVRFVENEVGGVSTPSLYSTLLQSSALDKLDSLYTVLDRMFTNRDYDTPNLAKQTRVEGDSVSLYANYYTVLKGLIQDLYGSVATPNGALSLMDLNKKNDLDDRLAHSLIKDGTSILSESDTPPAFLLNYYLLTGNKTKADEMFKKQATSATVNTSVDEDGLLRRLLMKWMEIKTVAEKIGYNDSTEAHCSNYDGKRHFWGVGDPYSSSSLTNAGSGYEPYIRSMNMNRQEIVSLMYDINATLTQDIFGFFNPSDDSVIPSSMAEYNNRVSQYKARVLNAGEINSMQNNIIVSTEMKIDDPNLVGKRIASPVIDLHGDVIDDSNNKVYTNLTTSIINGLKSKGAGRVRVIDTNQMQYLNQGGVKAQDSVSGISNLPSGKYTFGDRNAVDGSTNENYHSSSAGSNFLDNTLEHRLMRELISLQLGVTGTHSLETALGNIIAEYQSQSSKYDFATIDQSIKDVYYGTNGILGGNDGRYNLLNWTLLSHLASRDSDGKYLIRRSNQSDYPTNLRGIVRSDGKFMIEDITDQQHTLTTVDSTDGYRKKHELQYHNVLISDGEGNFVPGDRYRLEPDVANNSYRLQVNVSKTATPQWLDFNQTTTHTVSNIYNNGVFTDASKDLFQPPSYTKSDINIVAETIPASSILNQELLDKIRLGVERKQEVVVTSTTDPSNIMTIGFDTKGNIFKKRSDGEYDLISKDTLTDSFTIQSAFLGHSAGSLITSSMLNSIFENIERTVIVNINDPTDEITVTFDQKGNIYRKKLNEDGFEKIETSLVKDQYRLKNNFVLDSETVKASTLINEDLIKKFQLRGINSFVEKVIIKLLRKIFESHVVMLSQSRVWKYP